jgi:hypothetical protein
MYFCEDILSIIFSKLNAHDNIIQQKLRPINNLRLTCKYYRDTIKEPHKYLTNDERANLMLNKIYVPIRILNEWFINKKIHNYITTNISLYDGFEIINNVHINMDMINLIISRKKIQIFNSFILSNINTDVPRTIIIKKLIEFDLFVTKTFYVNNIRWFNDEIIKIYLSKMIKKDDFNKKVGFLYDIETYKNIGFIKNGNEICSTIRGFTDDLLNKRTELVNYYASMVNEININMANSVKYEYFVSHNALIKYHCEIIVERCNYYVNHLVKLIKIIQSSRKKYVLTTIVQLWIFLRNCYEVVILQLFDDDTQKFILLVRNLELSHRILNNDVHNIRHDTVNYDRIENEIQNNICQNEFLKFSKEYSKKDVESVTEHDIVNVATEYKKIDNDRLFVGLIMCMKQCIIDKIKC